ncbi:hypothetical protein JAAARDRAFT_124015 [Jaapia argillacea MUCL 33604]|uniref:Translation initiation factor IF-2, mitochondrial n=1 Tax=Jaapia argillacea MUCL 33604 TaxID=933084 RepID=A0A067QDI4_9AGAM|nr:hypothetical protein JAAARDRAFT_124015 [Jaapia argillacea MUCL 33604]
MNPSSPALTITFQDQHNISEDPSRRDRGPTTKAGRGHKTRGSLVSQIHHGEDVEIPNHRKSLDVRSGFGSVKVKKTKFNSRAKAVAVDLFIPTIVSVGTLSRLLNVRLEKLRRKMIQSGMEAEASPDHILTSDYASLLAMEFGRNPVINDEAAFDIYPPQPPADPSVLPSRPPVVTIMGHVDHGKTTLLDTLRSSSVAKSEAGGITQHMGAFSITVGDSRSVTFLDTPGHAAFSAMRARGASVTDVIVLVVAADDGVMAQTKEVIDLIKKEEGKVSVVVAINKVDKPGADVEKVQHALLAEGLQLESFGGDIPSVEVSGLTGLGLDSLVETISAVAEVQDLRAECDGQVQGHVLESKVHKGLGPVATVLLLRGTLKPGMHLICGRSHAKVRVMTSTAGATIKSAVPGDAVTVSGWKELPTAGDEVLSGSEADVKKALANRIRKAEVESSLVDLEAINEHRRLEREKRGVEVESDAPPEVVVQGPKELRLVIKADVSGSAEAVVGAVQGIGNDKAVVKIISSGVGEVTESDIMMAKASGAMVVAFSVRIPRSVESTANQNHVPVYQTSIIYSLMDDIKQRIISLLPVTVEKRVTGEATVLQLFDIHLKGKQIKKIAGCRVVNGLVERGKLARVVRNGEVIHEAPLDTLRQLKKDADEVRKGSECGLGLGKFEEFLEGDLVQVYHEIEHPGIL